MGILENQAVPEYQEVHGISFISAEDIEQSKITLALYINVTHIGQPLHPPVITRDGPIGPCMLRHGEK